MNASTRRLLVLVTVFVTIFAGVTVLRTWWSGGDVRSLIPGLSGNKGRFQPESFTLPEKAPLDLGQVELLSRLNDEYSKLTEAVVPSVVSIDTVGVRTEQFQIWGQVQRRQYPTQGQGSGVIVTAEGHVMTNHHVIAGQQKIQVTLHGGKTYNARLIGEDALLDIAVLKIESTEKFTPLKLGDSTQVQVGQMVFAVGNPFGLGETVTQGIISAKERSLSDNQRDLFQTDAAINPGNSGGPLVNLRGEIIGINVAIYSRDKENPGFQGVGFSIPSNDVRDALVQILERGRPIRGFLGVQMLDPKAQAALGYDPDEGAVVLGVIPGSPAQTAGLEAGDVVNSANGKKIKIPDELFSLIQRTKVGEEINLSIVRNGKSMELKAIIAESGASSTRAALPQDPGGQGKTRDPQEILDSLGVDVRDLLVPERLRGYRGVVVTRVLENGLAATKLRPGDLIVDVNNARISGANEFYLYLAASAAVQDTTLKVFRDGKVIRVDIPALPRK